MPSIKFNRAVFQAGTSYAVNQTVTSLTFAESIAFVQQGIAVWSAAPTAVPLPDSVDEAALVNVTAAAGGTPAAVDGYTVSHLPLGRTFRCVIGAKKCVYQIQALGGRTPDADGLIQPPDYDATGNDKVLAQIL